ncbi:uncharacterized protein LOC128627261 [Artibeus jamaicensis]|uniref:uncharacterized protein LOC128627261 n=1 Tax=Artibeus jamaicensis TaxID=9417 RepID=UPI00235AC264|nr:uncharacterized protein LOC128627261 [Artibeus jamaicensis]
MKQQSASRLWGSGARRQGPVSPLGPQGQLERCRLRALRATALLPRAPANFLSPRALRSLPDPPGSSFPKPPGIRDPATLLRPQNSRRVWGQEGDGVKLRLAAVPLRSGDAASAAAAAAAAARTAAAPDGCDVGSPFSRPAGHRQSVGEQEPRAEPARAPLLARRLPGAGLGAAGGLAAGGTQASGLEQGKRRGGRRSRRNRGKILALPRSPPFPLAAAPDADWGQRPGKRTHDPLPSPRDPLEFGLLQLFALWSTGSVFGGFPFSSSCLEPKAPSALRLLAPTHRLRGAARHALCNMRRLGTCLATLVGLLLTAAGEAFSDLP